MTNFVAITDYSFQFSQHPHCEQFSDILNNTYAEPFEDTTITTLFIDAYCTAVSTNIIALLRAAIITILGATSQTDHAIIAPIMNSLIFSVHVGNQQSPLRTPIIVCKALTTTKNTNKTVVLVCLNTLSLHFDCTRFNVMNFNGILIHGPVFAPGVATAGATATAGFTPLNATQVFAAATVTTTAANQALIVQQAVTAAAITATLPTKFNSNNLLPKTKARYKNHLKPSYLMTETDMQPFPTPTGGVCPELSYLNPPMGSSVTLQPNSNQIITQKGQFFLLADQGNGELKVFLASVTSCNKTSPKSVRIWYVLFTKVAATTGFYLHP